MSAYYFNKTISRMPWKNRLRILLGHTLAVNGMVEIDNHTGKIGALITDYEVLPVTEEKDNSVFGKMKRDVIFPPQEP